MLSFKIKQLIEKKGTSNAFTFLTKKCKISSHVAVKLLRNEQKSLSKKDMSSICQQLNCTPNDLFFWDNKTANLPDDHALNAILSQPEHVTNWNIILSTLPKESVSKLYQMAINEMQQGK